MMRVIKINEIKKFPLSIVRIFIQNWTRIKKKKTYIWRENVKKGKLFVLLIEALFCHCFVPWVQLFHKCNIRARQGRSKKQPF